MASPPLGSEAPFPAGSLPLPQSPTDSSYSCGNDSRTWVELVELCRGGLYGLYIFGPTSSLKGGKKAILVLERELPEFSSQLQLP